MSDTPRTDEFTRRLDAEFATMAQALKADDGLISKDHAIPVMVKLYSTLEVLTAFTKGIELELNEANRKLSVLPSDLGKDSSLETWYPITAERVKELEAKLHAAQQVATNNSDWFDALTADLSDLLKCENSPSAIIKKIEGLTGRTLAPQ